MTDIHHESSAQAASDFATGVPVTGIAKRLADRNLSRRAVLKQFAVGTGALASTAFLAACGGSSSSKTSGSSTNARTTKTLAIGGLVSSTGPFAVYGEAMVNGFKLYLEQHNNVLGGRPVEVKVSNTAGEASTALQQAQNLLENGIEFGYGSVTDPEALAMAPVFTEKQVPFVITGANNNDFTASKSSPYVYMLSPTFHQFGYEPARWFHDNVQSDDVWALAWDFTGGQQIIEAISAGLKSKGSALAGKILTPFPVTNDFTPYLTRLQNSGAKGLIAFYGGTDAISLMKQYQSFGLTSRLPLLGTTATVDIATIPALGNLVAGTHGSGTYVPTVNNPKNKEFVKQYKKLTGKVPNFYAVMAYDGAQYIDAVLTTTNGDTSDKSGLEAALAKPYEIDSPRGKFTMAPKYHSTNAPEFVWKNTTSKPVSEVVVATLAAKPELD